MPGWVYILTNKPHGVLYTGVTADLVERVFQHRAGRGSRFAHKYQCHTLVYAEEHERIEDAIQREKRIKEWPRLWKLRLIHEANPEWIDLSGS
ncbi:MULTISPECIES: GIY-YIG nuclease family protein [Sphingomonas]|uniref:GIY-YIG nuclease family protein n=1 Tax=Sphingomonas TaxID=13687 RepID=UPI000DF012B4|nr:MULTISPECIES: GIY-YIG nuclease family protein [Sphingomonas]